MTVRFGCADSEGIGISIFGGKYYLSIGQHVKLKLKLYSLLSDKIEHKNLDPDAINTGLLSSVN